MRKILSLLCALALLVFALPTALAEEAAEYTVAEKLLKQLDAGSGFSGVLEAAGGPENASLSFQWDYIHPRQNSETEEQQRLNLRLMNGEAVQTQFQAQWKNQTLRFQADLLSTDWYELSLQHAEFQENSAAAALNRLVSQTLKQNGIPSTLIKMLPLFVSLAQPNELLTPVLDAYLTRMDIWIEGYRGQTDLSKQEDGSGILSVQYFIPSASVKAQLKQLILDVLDDPSVIARLKEHFGEEQTAPYLNPDWQPYYFAAVDALPLNGDLTVERKVTLKGETLSLKISMPYSDPEAGDVTLRYTRASGEDQEPENEIAVLSGRHTLRLSFLQYSSMTDVSVLQGVLVSEPAGDAVYTVSDEQEKPLAAAFLIRSQCSSGLEEDGREGFRAHVELSLTPDQEHPDARSFEEKNLTLDLHFASRSPQKAATEAQATLTVESGRQSPWTFTLNGKTRAPWVPEAAPEAMVSLAELPEESWNALVQNALNAIPWAGQP